MEEMGYEHLEEIMGSNSVSFNDARENYTKYGACNKKFADRGCVRKPLADELSELYE